MSRKKLTKTIWFGSEVDITGQPILPPIADNPNDLNGLHEGELYLHNADEMPSIWVRTKSGLIKSVTGSGNIPSFWELKTTDNGFNYLYTKLPIVTQYGVTMYKGESLNLPSIYDGLPIDHDTIYWENGILKAKGGTGTGGIDEDAVRTLIESYDYATKDFVRDYVSENATGGIESITKQMVIDALGYTPYSAENPNGYITAASIPSALKNPYALTFGSKTYDGSSAKSITASDLGAALSSDLEKYLPLSGGTISGQTAYPLTINSNSGGSVASYMQFSHKNVVKSAVGYWGNRTTIQDAESSSYLAINSDGAFYNTNKLWHSGNDGSGSGLDADTLDGVHVSKLFQVNSAVDLGGTTANYDTLIVRYSNTSSTSNNPYSIVGGNQCVALNLYAGTNYAAQLAVGFGTNYLAYRKKVGSTSWQSWVKINAGLADEATKLQTARTIWGQSFDGTGDVTGNIVLSKGSKIFIKDASNNDICVTQIHGNDLHFGNGANSKGYDTYIGGNRIIMRYGTSSTWGFVLSETGNVGIGTTSPSKPLYIKSSINTPLFIEQSYSSSWTSALDAFNTSLVAGQHYNIDIGHSPSKWNHAWFGYYHAGNGSANNRLCLGLNQADDILNILASGNVGIGTTSPSAKLHVVGNILTTGGVTMQSARILKNVVDERGLSLAELSAIKPTRYTWKDKRDDRLHFGGIADDIEKVLPEVIYRTSDGTLTMDYGNAGFAIASSLIKPVVDHELEIRLLKMEVKELKERLNRYEA